MIFFLIVYILYEENYQIYSKYSKYVFTFYFFFLYFIDLFSRNVILWGKKMKKIIFGICCVFFTFLLCSCLTSNTSVNAFSSSAKIKTGNIVVSTDEFVGSKTAVHKDIGIDFSSGLYSLYFEPYFFYSDNIVNIFLKVQFGYFGNSVNVPEKIILLGTNERVVINLTSSYDFESETTSSKILGNSNEVILSEKISKNDYISLSEFFAKNEKIRLGFYTSSNKAIELKEYSTRAHEIFADLYSFYKENLNHHLVAYPYDSLIFQ